jgi:hypothetical protein
VSLFGHRRDLRLWQAELGDVERCLNVNHRHPPIEQVAADLRRLHDQLERLPAGASFIRCNGVRRAYDEVLVIACDELEVSTRLSSLPEGKMRDLERSRVEFMLGECGLRLT